MNLFDITNALEDISNIVYPPLLHLQHRCCFVYVENEPLPTLDQVNKATREDC